MLARICLFAGLLLGAGCASAFESDVHYGLTRWLALQAGFDEVSADTIATGDQRVDAGDMQYLDLVFDYACIAAEDFGSRRSGEHHYPTAGAIAGAPSTRTVLAGGDPAQAAARAIVKVPPGQAHYTLFRLGEALHILQDSWSHQGVPDVPQPAPGTFACDATRAWGHAAARGGFNSHRADLTMAWPADTRAMARASYEVLTHYPELAETPRKSRRWEQLAPLLDGFVAASTKTDKKRWFAAHGIADASFLEGISLPDGAQPLVLAWKGRKLPPLASVQSRQHDVDAELLDFYSRFFEQWVATEDFAALASAFGAAGAARAPRIGRAELTARLKAWRIRDHGRVAALAHASRPLSDEQRAAVDAIGRQRDAYAHYDSPAAAFFPLLPRGKGVSPLLPFFVGPAAPADGAMAGKAVAVARFRHAPYDSLAVVAEKIDGHWRVTSIACAVDH